MRVNQRKIGVVLAYASMFLNIIVSMLYTPVMLRLLGQSEYGLYQLVASVVAYLSLLSLGFTSAYMRYYSKSKVKENKDDIARLNGMFLTTFSIIGIIALICGGVLVTQIEVIFSNSLTYAEIETARILMIILVINLAMTFPFSVFKSNINANEHHFFLRILDIVKTVITPFVVLPLLLMGFQSIGMVVGTTILNFIIETIYTIYAIKKLQMKFSFKNFEFLLFKEIATYCSFIVLNMIADQLNWNVDKFLLGMYQGTTAVAIYSIAAQIKTYYSMFSTSVSNVFIPQSFQLVAKGASDKEITNFFTKIARIQFIVLSLILSGVLVFGQAFIYMWAGPEYQESYLILLIMIVPVTIPNIQSLTTPIQRAKNLHRFRSVLYFGIAIINLFISIPLCQYYGAVGCAIGTALATLIGHGLIMNIYCHKKIGLDMFYFWREMALLARGLVIPCFVGWLIVTNVNLYHIQTFLGFGVGYVCIFAISMWFIGANQYEKNLLLNIIKRIKR